MIQGIFFARFLPEQGTKVVAQSPPGCIVSVPGVARDRLFDFEMMAEYIIPRKPFCNRFLTIKTIDEKYIILCHPVCIVNEQYFRNEFIFSFGIVLENDEKFDILPYEAVVRRLAGTFTEMEIQSNALSVDQVGQVGEGEKRSISALLEIIKEDLDLYNECMIPVDEVNTINMKLFPVHDYPPPVQAWHVPVSKLNFADYMDDTWDLTMKKVVSQIDGVKDIRLIAHSADVSLNLTKIAIRHLLFYKSVLMLDMFLFGNIYAPTPDMVTFISRPEMQQECEEYVWHGPRVTGVRFWLCRLFTSLTVGRTLKEWVMLHITQDNFNANEFVDVRRFIQFGIIKGLIHRVHAYPVSSEYITTGKNPKGNGNGIGNGNEAWLKYVDGCHCFDQITVERNMVQAKIVDQLKKFPKGDVEVIYR